MIRKSESVGKRPDCRANPIIRDESVRKLFDTIYHTRAGPGKISVGVHGEGTVM